MTSSTVDTVSSSAVETQALDEAFDAARLASAKARAQAVFDPQGGGPGRIVVFGTREVGRRVVASARLAGLDVCAVADNDERRWGADVDGITICSPREAIERYSQSAAFVVAAYNPSGIVAQLRRHACPRIATYPEFFWNYSDFVHGLTGLALPENLQEHRSGIAAAYELLDDETSRREFASQIAWRASFDDAVLAPPLPAGDMHFDRSVYDLGRRETLVDCGAFDGDSLRAFCRHTDGAFERVYALEPDPTSRRALENYVDGDPALRGRVTVLPFAASDRSGTVPFEAGLGVTSSVSERGSVLVQCGRLDDVIDDPPTLIKMDIEGGEPLALLGAAGWIREVRPVLSVCAYHYSEHLWELPPLLRTLAPDHKIVLRRYAEQCWETTYYAVPPERAASAG